MAGGRNFGTVALPSIGGEAHANRREGSDAALVPVLTSTKVVCQPSPEARCAILPPPVPMLAKAGIVVSALFGGVKRRPSTLIRPPAGVSNSIVPRLFAVTGNPRTGSDNTKEVWPFPVSEMLAPAGPITAPVSSRMMTGILAACAEMFATATPNTIPLVSSNDSR